MTVPGVSVPRPMPLALTWYEWFKTGHVLAAVLWVGGGTTLAT